MADLVVVADDLTGAADTGAQFARGGRRVLVSFAPGFSAAADVAVLSTNSRYLAEREAAAAVRAAVAGLGGGDGSRWVYKKVDSTLRGHPAAELDALCAALPGERVLVAPAFPAQGRTVRAGRLLVGGVPLEETEFGAEAGSGDLRAVFGEAAHLDGGTLRDEGALQRVLAGAARAIADSETQDELALVGRAALRAGVRVFCGSAGLALALEDGLELPVSAPVKTREASGALLAVVGSRSAASAAQLERLPLPRVALAGPAGVPGAADELDKALAGGAAALQSGGGDWPQGAAAVAAALGETAARAVAGRGVGALVLTGGDTALAVCRALGASALWLDGEIERGMPRGRLADGPHEGLSVVTKAGGFGGGDALLRAVRSLGAAGA